jgi:hypothetical protein
VLPSVLATSGGAYGCPQPASVIGLVPIPAVAGRPSLFIGGPVGLRLHPPRQVPVCRENFDAPDRIRTCDLRFRSSLRGFSPLRPVPWFPA